MSVYGCLAKRLSPMYTLYVISETVFPVNHLTGTSKTEPKYNQEQLTTRKPKQPLKTTNIYKRNQMKLKPGLGASYTILPGNGVGLLHSPEPTNECVQFNSPLNTL